MPISAKQKQIVQRIADYVKKHMPTDSAHDWYHIERVWRNARKIAVHEAKANPFIVELGALLHDIGDYKFFGGDETANAREAEKVLKKFNVSEEDIQKLKGFLNNISFKGAKVKAKLLSLEGQIVQDADRLDAIGAIAIGRTFAWGGTYNREMYDPKIKPRLHKDFKSYKNAKSHTINHFYEKLLLLKRLLHTKTAKKIAAQRHKFMQDFLKQFHAEWNDQR